MMMPSAQDFIGPRGTYADPMWAQLWTSLGRRTPLFQELREGKLSLFSRDSPLPAGSIDGMSSLLPEDFYDEEKARGLLLAFLRYQRSASLPDLQNFYAMLQMPFYYPAINDLRTHLASENTLSALCETTAIQLCLHAPDHQAVKFGLILLSLYRDEFYTRIAKLFARHDEFTLFALEVLRTDKARFFQHLWELAPQVHGWGRIHLVKNLLSCPESNDPSVKLWFVTEGYRNSIFPPLLIPTIMQHVSLADLLAHCSQASFEKITSFLVCALESKHAELFSKAGWLSADLRRAYRLCALHKTRNQESLRVLEWMRNKSTSRP